MSDDLIRMKGQGRHVMTLASGRAVYSVIHFLDGGWGLQRDGQTFAVWEPDGLDDCVCAMAAAVPEAFEELKLVVVLRPAGDQSAHPMMRQWN